MAAEQNRAGLSYKGDPNRWRILDDSFNNEEIKKIQSYVKKEPDYVKKEKKKIGS